jgi:hypothetical protein
MMQLHEDVHLRQQLFVVRSSGPSIAVEAFLLDNLDGILATRALVHALMHLSTGAVTKDLGKVVPG